MLVYKLVWAETTIKISKSKSRDPEIIFMVNVYGCIRNLTFKIWFVFRKLTPFTVDKNKA